MVVVIARVLGASDVDAYWRFSHVKKVNNAAEVKRVGNQPFNILEIGSDSRGSHWFRRSTNWRVHRRRVRPAQ